MRATSKALLTVESPGLNPRRYLLGTGSFIMLFWSFENA
ncbi:elongation factor P [Marinobacter sp. ELB17]|nr:elongation factor P [Marinobacter sp. ELB17]